MSYSVTGLTDGSFYPANNKMYYTLSSSNAGLDNFRYLADIYINGSSSYTRLQVVPEPTYTSGVVDISGVVQSYLLADATNNTSTFNQHANNVCSVVVQFGEQYGNSSAVTSYPSITSKNVIAYNGVFDPLDYISYSPSVYIANDSSSVFLTDNPRIEVTQTEYLEIGFLNKTTNKAKYLRIRSYDVDGIFADQVTILNPYNTISTNGDRSINLNVSYAWLTSLVTGNLATGTAPFLLSTYKYYDLTLLDSALAVSSEVINIYIVEQCTKNTPIRFKFMNNYGKYDYYTFTGATRKNTDIKRNTFKGYSYTWSSTGYLTNTRARGTTNFETKLTDTINIQSDWITEAQSIWLEQLVSSPDVYIIDGTSLVAVTITDTSYQTKYEASEQLFNLSISFQYAQNRTRQRR